MKKNLKIVVLITVFMSVLVMFVNCSVFGDQCDPVNPNSKHRFWVSNLNPGMFGQNYCEVGTKEPYEGNYVNVYMDYNKHDPDVVRKVAEEFDLMYPTITAKFGNPVMSDKNSYNGKPQKVTVLLFDIKDGYDATLNPSYVGGYFYSVDYLTQESLTSSGYEDKSNEQAIMYIDIHPQDVTKDDVYSTVAHEFQHMLNFCENILDGGNNQATLEALIDGGVPTWIDEGFSMSAERIWAEEIKNLPDEKKWPIYDRITYFNSPEYFVEGNPLIKWIREEQGYDVLSNYSTSFIFMQYLVAHHSQKSGIFKIMTDQKENDIRMIDPIIASLDFSSQGFDDLFEKWIIANVINNSSTHKELGYNNDKIMKDVKAVVGSEGKTWGFYPGSFVYRKTDLNPQLISSLKFMRFGENGKDQNDGEYLVIYNPDKNPEGNIIEATVPSGETVPAATRFVNVQMKPQRIDFSIKKPISTMDPMHFGLPIKRQIEK